MPKNINIYSKKYYFLILYILFISYQKIFSLTQPFLYKCLKDDIKIKNLCAIEGVATEEDENSNIMTNNYLYIKKKCKDKQYCSNTDNSGLYFCFKKLKKRKIGEKCSVNEECYTNKCSMRICQGTDFEGDCTDYPNSCKPGMYCTYSNIYNKNICVEYSKKNEKCGYFATLGYEKKCFSGFVCQEKDDNSGDTVCKNWGILEIGKVVTDEKLCKSGISLQDTDYDNKVKCVSVEEDSECDESTLICKPQVTGLGVNPDITTEVSLNCFGGINNLYSCPITYGKTEIFEKYIERYNKVYDMEKLQKSQYFVEGSFNDRKLSEMYTKYVNYNYLYTYGFIDYDGNAEGLYQCEYDFIWRFLDGKIIKVHLLNFLFGILCVFC